MNKAPAYQMYAGDWLKSRSVRLMDDYQRGWYIQLLNEAWDGDPQCMLPKDDETLQRLAGVSDVVRDALNHGSTAVQPLFNRKWAEVRSLFVDEGKYCYNKRQMEEFAKQRVFREKQAAKGEASAKKRKNDRIELDIAKNQILVESTTVQPRLVSGSTEAQPDGNRKATLHLLSSSPSSNNTPLPPKGGDSVSKNPKKKRDAIPDEAVPLLNRLAVVKDGRKGPRFSPSKAWAIVQSTRAAGISDEDLERFWRSTCKQRATGDEPSFWPTFHVIAKVNDIKFWLLENPPGREDHQGISRGHDPGSEKAQARIKELQELAKQNAEREKQQRAASPVHPVESIDFNNLFKP